MRLSLAIAALAAAVASPSAARTPAPSVPAQLPPKIVDGRMIDQLGESTLR